MEKAVLERRLRPDWGVALVCDHLAELETVRGQKVKKKIKKNKISLYLKAFSPKAHAFSISNRLQMFSRPVIAVQYDGYQTPASDIRNVKQRMEPG